LEKKIWDENATKILGVVVHMWKPKTPKCESILCCGIRKNGN